MEGIEITRSLSTAKDEELGIEASTSELDTDVGVVEEKIPSLNTRGNDGESTDLPQDMQEGKRQDGSTDDFDKRQTLPTILEKDLPLLELSRKKLQEGLLTSDTVGNSDSAPMTDLPLLELSRKRLNETFMAKNLKGAPVSKIQESPSVPKSLNESNETAETAPLESDANTSSESNDQYFSDIFTDVFDQITDIAVDLFESPILNSHKTSSVENPKDTSSDEESDEPEMIETSSGIMEDEEPGKIVPSSSNLEDEGAKETDTLSVVEEDMEPGKIGTPIADISVDTVESLPFDEVPKTPQTRNHKRIRGQDPKPTQRGTKSEATSSNATSIRDKDTQLYGHDSDDENYSTESEGDYPKGHAYHTRGRSLAREASEVDDDSTQVETNDCVTGFFQPITAAMRETHDVLMDAIFGDVDDDSDYECSECSDSLGSYSDDDVDDDYDDDSVLNNASVAASVATMKTRARSGNHGKSREKEVTEDEKSDLQVDDMEDEGFKSLKNRTFLQNITNRGIPLIFHSSSPKPQKVYFKLEMQTSDNADDPQRPIEPYIAWEEIEEAENCRKSRFSKRNKYEIRFFSITSVQKAEDSMNATSFRSANPKCCILITLADGNVFLFEASNEYETRKVIHGLRWVQARLAFNIVIGNMNVCSEMISLGAQKEGDTMLTSGDMLDMTNQLVDNAAKKLDW